MKEYAALIVLVLVMLGGIYSLDHAYSYSEDAVFGKQITGAITATTEQCAIEGGKAICIEDGRRTEYSSRITCREKCGKQIGAREGAGQTGTAVTTCTDNDGDGFWEGCEQGPDCNDAKEELTNNCNVCGNAVVEKSSKEECDMGEENNLWRSDVSKICSSGTVVHGQSRCTTECKLERKFPDCPEGEGGMIEEVEVVEVKEELCRLDRSRGKVVCTLDEKEFSSRIRCKEKCVPELIEVIEVGEGVDVGKEAQEKADLIVRITEAPDEMIRGNFYRVKVRVTNRGGASTLASRFDKTETPAFSTGLQLVNEGRNFRIMLGGKREITNLNHGESKTRTFGFRVPETVSLRDYKFEVFTDSEGGKPGEIQESDEDNNADSKDVRVRVRRAAEPVIEPEMCIEEEIGKVVCLSATPQENYGTDFDLCERECSEEVGAEGPDLEVEIVDPPGEVVTGQFHDVTVKVTNVGRERVTTSFSTALDFVNAEDSSQRSRVGDFGVSLLSPGRSIEHTFERWGVPATASEQYKFEARADTENRVSGDVNRENNHDENSVTVREGIGQPQSCFGEGREVHQIGTRTDNRYCGSDGNFKVQKASKIACQNSFECRTNICAAGVCIDSTTLNNALARIQQ